MPSVANMKIAQKVASMHYAIACAENQRISRYDLPVYRASYNLLVKTIREVYGLSALKAQRVYDVMLDQGFDDLAGCVLYVRENRESDVYTR